VRRTLSALPATLAVVALAVTLAGCSAPAADPDGFDQDGCATSGPASESVKVTGDFGEEPKVEFKEDLTAANANTERSVVIEGDGKGEVVELGSSVTVNLVFYDVATSTEIIPFTENPEPLAISNQILPGIVDTLTCATPGQRIVGVVPPERAFGADGNADAGIGPDATLLVVFDVVDVTPPLTPSEWTENVPTVTRDDAGMPTVTIPDVPAPTELQSTVLVEGDGDVVERGDNVTLDYQGTSWDTKTVFDQSFGKAPITNPVAGFVPGFTAALVGQKVGSTILVTIPPQYAYGTDPAAHELGGQTLVFLIDIKATEAP
jgi:FKBP-type peptidyl-prolyl cis-trans isomerase